MSERGVGKKRGHLHSIVGRIGAETIVKSKRLDCDGEVPERKFVNPLLLHNPKYEIQEIEPMEPTKKTKIYVLQKPAGLTNGAYLSCSSCGRHAFKLYRVVKCKVAPLHLQKLGTSENDILRICKRCWYQGSNTELHPKELATRPFFQNETPLGLTNRRACLSWHFLRRDIVRKRVTGRDHIDETRDNESSSTDDDDINHNELTSVVTLIVNGGNSFPCQANGVSLYSKDGTWLGVDEARYYGHSQSAASGSHFFDFDRHSFESLVCDNLQTGKEVEPQAALIDHDYTTLFAELEIRSDDPPSKVETSLQAKKTADKLLKHSIKKAKVKVSKTPLKNLKASHPLSRENKNKGKTTNKAEVTSGQVHRNTSRQDKACCVCGIPILKSYGSYKRENAPEKLRPYFTNGIIAVRACRRCVPYQKPSVPLKMISKSGKGKKLASKLPVSQKKVHASSKQQKPTVTAKVTGQVSKSPTKTKTHGNVHFVLKSKGDKGHSQSVGSKQSKQPPVNVSKHGSVLSPTQIDLTGSDEESKSIKVLTTTSKESVGEEILQKGTSPNPKLCVICYNPVGKSYRRCTYDETPSNYKYVFEIYKGEVTLRICRKCLARKSWSTYVRDKDDSIG